MFHRSTGLIFLNVYTSSNLYSRKLEVELGMTEEEFRTVSSVIGDANDCLPIVFNKAVENINASVTKQHASPGQIDKDREFDEIRDCDRSSKANAIKSGTSKLKKSRIISDEYLNRVYRVSAIGKSSFACSDLILPTGLNKFDKIQNKINFKLSNNRSNISAGKTSAQKSAGA